MTQEQPGSTRKGNYNTQSALDFHEQTKHSEVSVRARSRALDWSDKPNQFKLYDDPSLTRIFLPREFPRPEASALDAVLSTASTARITEKVDIKTLAEVLFYSAGLTREMHLGQGETIYMRAASATGALYPIEVYVVCGEMNGFKAGVYHFAPREFALVKLRDGDHRGYLASIVGSGDKEGVTSAPFTIVFTSLAWRNAWKYEERSYRHWFWDCGVIAANLLAVCASEGLKARLITGFIDKEVDGLLGLEKEKEATVALSPVGIGLETSATYLLNTRLPQLRLKAVPLSEQETDYPIIWETNEASSLRSRIEVIEWKKELSRAAVSLHRSEEEAQQHTYPSQSKLIPLRLEQDVRSESLLLYETILRRGSTRRFARRAIPFAKLSWILESSSSSSGVPLDATDREEQQKNLFSEIYLIVNQVEGCPSGSFFFNKEKESLELLKLGNLRNMSSYLCLEQSLFGDASAVLFLMTDLRYVLDGLGNRGYRVAQLEAGVAAGRIYLSSCAQRLGASGSTFYDDAVTEFFSPHAEGKSCMIAVGIGVPDYKARPGKMILSGTQEEEKKQSSSS